MGGEGPGEFQAEASGLPKIYRKCPRDDNHIIIHGCHVVNSLPRMGSQNLLYKDCIEFKTVENMKKCGNKAAYHAALTRLLVS